MTRLFRDPLVSLREMLTTAGPLLLLSLLLLAGAYFVLKPAPPKRVVLATGPEQSAYAEFGKRYQKALSAYGIKVVLQPTRGSLDNLRALRDPKRDVDLGFVQGGSSEAARNDLSEKIRQSGILAPLFPDLAHEGEQLGDVGRGGIGRELAVEEIGRASCRERV